MPLSDPQVVDKPVQWKGCQAQRRCQERAEFVVMFVPVCRRHLAPFLHLKLAKRPVASVGLCKENAA